tara:strand:- start:128 stop:1186 length:1059 start_codon:yes stop_codon:yes gene_type:complete
MKLFYLTSSDLKAMPANAVQTTNMTKAFLNIGCSVKYFVKETSHYYPNGLMWSDVLLLLHILVFKIFNFKDNIFIHSRDRNKLAITLAFLGFKVGIEFHNLKRLNSFETFVLRFLIKKGGVKLFFTSKTLYDRFIFTNFQGTSLPYTKLENAAPENLIKQVLHEPINNKNLSFAMVSNKRIGKGQEKIHQLSQLYPDYKFTIVGPTLSIIKKTKNLNLIGKINNDELFTYLKDADVLLALIDKKMEVAGGRFEDGDLACPLKIFEYLALAKPIIMSKRTAMIELFSFLPGVWFVSDDLSDFNFVVNEIQKLDKIELKNIQSSHKEFINNLSWENRAKLVLSVLNEKNISGRI